MDELRQSLSRFRLRLMLRLATYAALTGLVIALVIVVAAPWLRDAAGLPGYYATMALPLILPALYVALVFWRRPDETAIAMAADSWCGGGGAVVSAVELAREHPDSPFMAPVAARAVNALKAPRLPEPRLLRRLLIAFAVLFLMLPLSRWAHAQMAEDEAEERAQEEARKTEPPADAAETLAREAGKAAQEAEKLGATQAGQLAEDLEEAARKAQAGPQDKERALREANALADRANAQRQGQESRAEARESLAENEATKDLAKAIENVNERAIEREARELAQGIHKPEGGLDKAKAEALLKSIEEAAAKAPNDPRLRRAADELRKQLNEQAMRQAQAERAEIAKQSADPALLKEALEAASQLDREQLEKALQEFADAASKLRDIEPTGNKSDELAEKVKQGQLTPEQAREMAETAAELAKRLELDAETLRELLKQGKEFEGMEELAKEMLEQQAQENPGFSPDEIPEWAREFAEEALKQQWQEQARREAERRQGGERGEPREGGQGGEAREGREGGEGGEGSEGREGGERTGDPTRTIDGEGGKEGIDSKDTGGGDKDPEKDPKRLDPSKAGDERANRDETGRESGSKGINTRQDEETLPRRYRDAARKYFER